ncbi:MAG: 50S ribosomal protein L24 [Nitrospirae bacterium]|nr:50S ribosomal protein L24 [Nitrospirota bacterium]
MARTVKIRKDDQVLVIAGRDSGKRGKVLSVDAGKGHVVVEKVHIIKRHSKPTPKNQQGGILEYEAPVQISNVMVLCGSCGAPTRVGHRLLADGGKLRICKRCGESVDKK